MISETERAEPVVVLAMLRKCLQDPMLRAWRIERLGREIVTGWGDVYSIEDDGTLTLTHQVAPE